MLGFGIYGMFLGGSMKNPKHSRNLFVYYTNISNIAVIAYDFLLLIAAAFSERLFEALENNILRYILMNTIFITHIVYNYILLPAARRHRESLTDTEREGGAVTFNNICVHYIVPILFMLQWLFFAKKELGFSAVLIWMLIPIVYCVYIFIRARLGLIVFGKNTPYPYFFIDLPLIGKKRFIINLSVCLLAFFILGSATYGISLLIK